jgi:hypothetical protein
MRNGWLVGGQTFLFTAYAATLAVRGHRANAANELFYELPVIGIFLAALIFITVNAALARLRGLKREFDNLHERPERYPSIISGKPRIFGHFVVIAVPVLFVASWIAVLSFR